MHACMHTYIRPYLRPYVPTYVHRHTQACMHTYKYMIGFYFCFFPPDDFEEIKQDISSFRYEMLNQWRSREGLLTDIATNVTSLAKHVEALRNEFSKKPETISEDGEQK